MRDRWYYVCPFAWGGSHHGEEFILPVSRSLGEVLFPSVSSRIRWDDPPDTRVVVGIDRYVVTTVCFMSLVWDCYVWEPERLQVADEIVRQMNCIAALVRGWRWA